jgi:hypothetical protein
MYVASKGPCHPFLNYSHSLACGVFYHNCVGIVPAVITALRPQPLGLIVFASAVVMDVCTF